MQRCSTPCSGIVNVQNRCGQKEISRMLQHLQLLSLLPSSEDTVAIEVVDEHQKISKVTTQRKVRLLLSCARFIQC